MRFLLLNQTFYPDELATSQQLLDLAKFLVKNGHEVSVIADRRNYERRNVLHKPFEQYQGIDIHRVRSTGFGKSYLFLRLIDALSYDFSLVLKLLFFPKPDFVISFTSPPLIGFIGALYAKFKGTRSVQWLMDINPDIAIAVGFLKKQSLVSRFLEWVNRFAIQQSKYVVVLDRWMKNKISPILKEGQKTVIVHPWAVVSADEKKMPEFTPSKFRSEYGLQDKFIVLYSGNHSLVHPLDTLLEAALKSKDDKSIAFAFVGFGARTEDVKVFKETHRLGNIIQLPLQSRELYGDMLKSCNLQTVVMGQNMSGLLHPSKIYSILASGRPFLFVGPKESHVVDLLAVHPYGFAAENGEVDKVLSAISTVKKYQKEDYEKIFQKNIPYVRDNFSIETSLSNLLKELGASVPEANGPQVVKASSLT